MESIFCCRLSFFVCITSRMRCHHTFNTHSAFELCWQWMKTGTSRSDLRQTYAHDKPNTHDERTYSTRLFATRLLIITFLYCNLHHSVRRFRFIGQFIGVTNWILFFRFCAGVNEKLTIKHIELTDGTRAHTRMLSAHRKRKRRVANAQCRERRTQWDQKQHVPISLCVFVCAQAHYWFSGHSEQVVIMFMGATAFGELIHGLGLRSILEQFFCVRHESWHSRHF